MYQFAHIDTNDVPLIWPHLIYHIPEAQVDKEYQNP